MAEKTTMSPALWPAGTTRCPDCAVDLSRLPASSRYCPRCGAQTRIDVAAPVESIAGDSPLIEDGTSNTRRGVSSAAPLGPSLVLKGYANALYNLGRRYETAFGAARNLREAERCYRKAARLGNFGALARLAAQWFA